MCPLALLDNLRKRLRKKEKAEYDRQTRQTASDGAREKVREVLPESSQPEYCSFRKPAGVLLRRLGEEAA